MPSNELTHFGVKGMKWGRRRNRSGSSGGLSRGAAGQVRRNNRQVELLKTFRGDGKNAKAVKVARVMSTLDRTIIGKQRYEKFLTKHIDYLNAQTDRINSGKTTVRDKLDRVMNVSVLDVIGAARDAKKTQRG